MKSRVAAFLMLSLIIIASAAQAQETFKTRSSPLALASVRYKDAYLKITYSQPQKRGREIFGKLVPFGEVWRTGANEATELTTTKDILVNNQILKAGTYSIFTIPSNEKWTIIINNDVGLWGAYNYTRTLDVMRFDVPVQANNPVSEAFTMSLDGRNDIADLSLRWDNVKLSIPIKFIN